MTTASEHHIRRVQPGAKMEALCGLTAGQNEPLVCGPPSSATCWVCISLACGRPIPSMPETPEHERLKQAKKTDDATQLIGEFLDWLKSEKGYLLCRYPQRDHDDDCLVPVREPVTRLLAEFFGVDENALESEKQALLKHMREVNAAVSWAKGEGRQLLKDL